MNVLVAGATGFIGRALVPALCSRGHQVRACSRRPEATPRLESLEAVYCDLLDVSTLVPALDRIEAVYYLVHSLGAGADYRERDRRQALNFVAAASASGVRRIVYLGGVAPRGRPSEHLASRLEVGRILRSGRIPALELRAAMIVGPGSASWQIVRDLALRLPVMVFPAWVRSRLSPIALEDVIRALEDALAIPLPASAWYDIPGPEILSAREILERIAALEGRRLPAVSLPWLTRQISALWLKLVTRADFALARELVFGLTSDLLPANREYWKLTGHPPRVSFDEAARAALEHESRRTVEERLVRRFGPRGEAA